MAVTPPIARCGEKRTKILAPGAQGVGWAAREAVVVGGAWQAASWPAYAGLHGLEA